MDKKKPPGWVIIVGVLGILMSCCGIYSGSSMMIVPKMFEFQKKFMPEMMDKMMKNMPLEKNFKLPGGGVFPSGSFAGMYGEMMKAFSGDKTWFNTWCYISGAILLLLSGFYLFASIMFFRLNPNGIMLFYLAVILSCLYSIVNSIIFMTSGSFFALAFIIGSVSSFIFNLVLLFVVITGDKKVFTG